LPGGPLPGECEATRTRIALDRLRRLLQQYWTPSLRCHNGAGTLLIAFRFAHERTLLGCGTCEH
jgi:hypothetical protein